MKKTQKRNQPLWKKLFKIGLRNEFSFETKSDIILVNQSVFVIGLVLLIIAVVDLVIGFNARAAIAFFAFSILLFTYFLQNQQKFYAAKLNVVAIPIFVIVAVSITFGTKSLTFYYLLATFCLSLIIFHKEREHITALLIHLGSLLTVILYSKYWDPVIPGEDSGKFSFLNIFFLMITIYLVIKFFTSAAKLQKRKIKELVNTLNHSNHLLESQNAQIKNQAKELSKSNSQLRIALNDYKIAQRNLLNSNQELAQFAYAASHDLKEPLRTIGSFSQLVAKKLQNSDDESLKEYLSFMTDGSKRMSALLDDLLNYSRLNNEVPFEEIDLNYVLNVVIHNLKHQLEKTGGEIQLGEMPIIQGNKTQLHQLFQNLISNGLKFNREGVLPKIEIGCAPENNKYRFWIKDNGIGISEEFKEKVFVIFQRLHRKDEYDGTGIGLSICKKVVQNHGGKIWFESVKGEGTVFCFTLKKSLKNRESEDLLSDVITKVQVSDTFEVSDT